MPSDVALADAPPEQAPARPDRQDIVAFVTDAATESVLRDGLIDAAPHGIEVHRTGIRARSRYCRRRRRHASLWSTSPARHAR